MPQPLFQHRHYAEIARIIASLPADCYGVEQIADHFAKEFRGTNDGYSESRFRDAANGNPQGRDR